jgi:hypothetical protein
MPDPSTVEILTREGPTLTNENGALDYQYPSCRGCKWLRVHDWHYFYCRDLGDKSKPDYTSVYSGGMRRIFTYPRPLPECRFQIPAEDAPPEREFLR